MIKNIFIISDVELGQGDIFDDFKDEQLLIDFIHKITAEKGKNILVLNGDTFDFLKMHYQNRFTHHITEEISLWKMQKIIETYPRVFQALSSFLNKSANRIHFNIGNHDHDLYWPAVQNLLIKTLKHPSKVNFGENYQTADIHIEHGNQVDYFYKMDAKNPFLEHKGQKLLNLPFGYVAVSKYFIELKRHFPLEEKLYPRHHVFESYPEFKKLKQKIAINFVVKGLLLNFVLSLGDPISNVPYINLVKHVFKHGLEIYDEKKFLTKRFNNLVKLYPGKKAYLMGHLHLIHHDISTKKGHIFIVTDTWREEYNFTREKKQILKPKTYAKICYDNDKLQKVDLLTFS